MERPHLYAFLHAVTDRPLLARAVGDLRHELLSDLREEIDPLHREARLARVEESADRGSRSCATYVGVVADDHRIASPELERHARDVLGSELHDPLARLGLAGESDLVDFRM